MSLIDQITVVRATLSRHQDRYQDARAARPELALYPTAASAAGALDASSALTPPERYALLSVIVDEQAKGPHPVWGSLLLIAFTPLLLQIRSRLRFPEDEERDHRVLLAFFTAINSPGVRSAGPYVAAALVRATKKALVVERAKERVADLVPFDEELHSPWQTDAISEAELRIEAFWAARRAERAVAHIRPRQPSNVRTIRRRRRAA